MLGMGLNLSRPMDQVAWWPQGASYALDLVNKRAVIDGIAVSFDAAMSFARASEKWAQTQAGEWRHFGVDEPAITDQGLLLEPAFTELGNFADCAGAVPGVVGAGGALPTGWSETATTSGVTVTVLESGTATNGLPYVDIRFAGTPSENWRIRPSPVRHLNVTGGMDYVASAWVSLVGGAVVEPNHLRMGPVWYGAGGTYISAGFNDTGSALGSSLTRISYTYTAPGSALTANVDFFSVSIGATIDFSLRFAAPNIGVAQPLSSPVLSSGTPKVRAGDVLTLLLPNGDHVLTLIDTGGVSWPASVVSGAHAVDGALVGGYVDRIVAQRT